MKKYDEEFKQSTVKKVFDGQSVASVARDLGISQGLLHKWKKRKIESSSDLEPRLGFECENDGAISDRCFSDGAPACTAQARRDHSYRSRFANRAAVEFRCLLYIYGFRQSMSAKENCYDNAQAKSFFSRFKAELVEDGIFESIEEARTETFSYIDGYYNRIRRHSGLGYKSPLEFERELRIKNIGRRDSFLC